MFEICKRFDFSASHRLLHLPETHPCHNLHGHNYQAIFYFRSDSLDNNSFVIDYRSTGSIKEYIDIELDHKHLNHILGLSCPTSEQIAKHLYNKFKIEYPSLWAVEVKETDKTGAKYFEQF